MNKPYRFLCGWGIFLTALLLPMPGRSYTVTLKAEAETAVLIADRPGQAMIRIALEAPETAAVRRLKPQVHLAIALDRSSSMYSQNKLEYARRAARNALELLADGDTFALITYASSAEVLIPATRLTPETREWIRGRIDAITPGGSTALFAGVSLAAHELTRFPDAPGQVKRLILLSDGLANVGPNSTEELGRLGAGLIKEQISVSTVGVGGDYNEDLMTALAQNSDGNFYFVENSRDLPVIFEKELGSALAVAAQQLKIRIVCPPGVKPLGILGHECTIVGQTVEMNFNQLYAGHSKVLILQVEVPPAPAGSVLTVARLELNYRDLANAEVEPLTGAVELQFSADRKVADASVNADVRSEVARQTSNVMREEALQRADAGDIAGGVQRLKDAQAYLDNLDVGKDSPEIANASRQIREETEKLEQIQAAPAGSASADYSFLRKEVKGRSYQSRNSQMYQQ